MSDCVAIYWLMQVTVFISVRKKKIVNPFLKVESSNLLLIIKNCFNNKLFLILSP